MEDQSIRASALMWQDRAPAAHGLLRPRLLSALDDVLATRLGLIVAPHGTGKTSLMAQWAERSTVPVIWVRADSPDAMPGRLLQRIAEAASTAHADTFGPGIRDLAHGLARPGHDVVIAVDDFHTVAGTSAERELETLLLATPPRVHLLAAGRTPPSFNLARSELPAAVVLGTDALRFRAAETRALFRKSFHRTITPADATLLNQMVGGWAAALQLFQLATSGRNSAEVSAAIHRLRLSAHFAADYLEHQVLAGVPGPLVDLLRRASQLDTLSAGRCNALPGLRGRAVDLLELEGRGLLQSQDDSATFSMEPVLRTHLLYGPMSGQAAAVLSADRAALRALMADRGDIAGLLNLLARESDWPGLEAALECHGALAIAPGTCGWAARLPAELLQRNPWSAVAEARRLLDDGAFADAGTLAEKTFTEHPDHPAARFAHSVRETARRWGPQPEEPRGCPADALRAATRNSPGYYAGSVLGSGGAMADLAAGLALQLAGNQRASLPLLTRCAGQADHDAGAALAAQLALAVVGPLSACPDPYQQGTAAESVSRQACALGFTWLARLAGGIAAALETGQDAREIQAEAVADCDARGDGWGAALIAMVAALARMRQGVADPAGMEALAERFRWLGAGTLEAWVRSAEALAAFSAREPDAEETAVRAELYARKADIPGAAALSYAALAFHRPDRQQELIQLANSTARNSGLVWRPWTWLKAPADPVASRPAMEVVEHVLFNDISVRCLGGFTLQVGGAPVELSRVRPRARTVLRMLALHAGRPVHRERLAGALWAELDYPAALHNLQVSLSSLRGALQRDPGNIAERLIVRHGEAYCFAPGEAACCDLQEFDEALREAGRAHASLVPFAALPSLRRVVELYAGEVLPEDGSADWVVPMREHYKQRAAESASKLALLELKAGQPDAAMAAATRGVDIDPWRDASWRTLVGVCQTTGNHAAAERTQRNYQRMLKDLGVESRDLAGVPAR